MTSKKTGIKIILLHMHPKITKGTKNKFQILTMTEALYKL